MKKDKINDNLEGQAQALFKSWFVDFEPFQNGEFVDSELGRMPKGWRVSNLSDFILIKYGKAHKELSDGKIPAYGSGGIIRYVNSFLYSKETILIPRKGTLNNVIYLDEQFWTVDTMFYSELKIENAGIFVFLFLKSIDLSSMNTGSAVPSMTIDVLESLKTLNPTPNIMFDFESVTKPMFEKMKKNDVEIEKLSHLRDTLLPKLMSGELSVDKIEI